MKFNQNENVGVIYRNIRKTGKSSLILMIFFAEQTLKIRKLFNNEWARLRVPIHSIPLLVILKNE